MNRNLRKEESEWVVTRVSHGPRGHSLDVDPRLNCHCLSSWDMTVGISMYLCIDAYAMSFEGEASWQVRLTTNSARAITRSNFSAQAVS